MPNQPQATWDRAPQLCGAHEEERAKLTDIQIWNSVKIFTALKTGFLYGIARTVNAKKTKDSTVATNCTAAIRENVHA